MRKGNKIFEALSANFERANSPFCIGCVKPDESAALDELFAIPQSVAPSLLDGMQNLSSETGAAGAPGERVSRLRGGSTAPGVGGSCPPTTNRGPSHVLTPIPTPQPPTNLLASVPRHVRGRSLAASQTSNITAVTTADVKSAIMESGSKTRKRATRSPTTWSRDLPP